MTTAFIQKCFNEGRDDLLAQEEMTLNDIVTRMMCNAAFGETAFEKDYYNTQQVLKQVQKVRTKLKNTLK